MPGIGIETQYTVIYKYNTPNKLKYITMKTTNLKLRFPMLLSFIALLFMGLSANAQESRNYDNMRNTTAEDYAKQQTDQMIREYKIDESKRQQVYDMNLRYANQQIPIANSDMAEEDLNNRMRAIESSRYRDFKGVMDEDQYTRFGESMGMDARKKSPSTPSTPNTPR